MFNTTDITRLESIYGVDIKIDTTGYKIIVKGSADLLKQCREDIISSTSVGLAVEFIEVVSAGCGTIGQKIKPMNFVGLWRSVKDERKCLLRVIEWQLGSSFHNGDKLKIKAQIVRMDEGQTYPKVLELMLPKRKGVVMEVESWWYSLTAQLIDGLSMVELSGKVYGPPPLNQEYPYLIEPEPNYVNTPKVWGSINSSKVWNEKLSSIDDKKFFDVSQPPSMLTGMEQIKSDIIGRLAIPDLTIMTGMDRFLDTSLGLPYEPDKNKDKISDDYKK